MNGTNDARRWGPRKVAEHLRLVVDNDKAPKNAPAAEFLKRALKYYEADNPQAAAAVCECAIDLSPTYAEAHALLAAALVEAAPARRVDGWGKPRQEYIDALAACELAIKLNSGYSDTLFHIRAFCLLATGRGKEISPLLEQYKNVDTNTLSRDVFLDTIRQYDNGGNINFDFENEDIYYKTTMSTDITSAVSTLQDRELKELQRAVAAEIAERETAKRAAGKPHPENAPLARTAEDLFGVSKSTPARRYHRSADPEFSEAELADRALLSAADAVCNDMKKRSKTLSPGERDTWLRAARFAYQARHPKVEKSARKLTVG